MTYSEVDGIVRNADGSFAVESAQKSILMLTSMPVQGVESAKKSVRSWYRISTTTTWSHAGLRILLFHRRYRRRPSSIGAEKRPVPLLVRATSKPAATFRWSGRAATKKPSTCIWKTHLWWAAWRGRVMRRASPTAHAARKKERFKSAASSGSWRTATTPSTPNRNTVRLKTSWTPASPLSVLARRD